jgi:hypothetical protein
MKMKYVNDLRCGDQFGILVFDTKDEKTGEFIPKGTIISNEYWKSENYELGNEYSEYACSDQYNRILIAGATSVSQQKYHIVSAYTQVFV